VLLPVYPQIHAKQVLLLRSRISVLQELIEVQHSLPENKRTLCAVLLTRPLFRTVRDAILTSREHHACRTKESSHRAMMRSQGVCACAAITASTLHTVNRLWPESAWLKMQHRRKICLETLRRCNLLGFVFGKLSHTLEPCKLWMHDAKRSFCPRLDIAGADRARLDVHRGRASITAVRQVVQGCNQSAGADQCVPAALHGVRIRMAIFAMECHLEEGDALPPLGPSDGLTSFFEACLLLDVNLEVSRDRELLECVRTITNIADGL